MPQAFSNITKPCYRSGPPATVQEKELVKLEYITRENISIANFQQKLFVQFRTTQDGPTLEQIMLQLYQIKQQEASQMQFMLDISRSMSKAYADLVANFISSLTNLVLIRDAYLSHAHPNLDAFRLHKLRSATISGGDFFDRTLMQEYEQHLIGLGVKPGSKKTVSTPTRNTRRVEVDSLSPRRDFSMNQCRHPSIWCNNLFFPPGQRPTTTSDNLSDYPLQCVRPEGTKSVTTLQEREKTPCFHTPPEWVSTLCIQTPREGENTPCFHTPQEGVKTPCVNP